MIPDSNSPDRQQGQETQLSRTLRLRDLTMLIVGTVIGSGIFLVPGKVLYEVNGRIEFALLVWVAGGLLSLLGALTYGELSAANPKAGGLYVYIRDAFGPIPAFLYGWALFFVICSGNITGKTIPEHADHGPAHCNAVERGLGNHDGTLPFR